MTGTLFLPESWDKRKFICPSLLLTAVLSFMIGPSSIFNFPDSPLLIGLGILLHCGARGISIALCPSEAIKGGVQTFPG